ncbi:serine--tRNA ligase [Cerasicoccus arenae]|uniref:Serine--tRNA ligase n=1 Tax=Cerasicoccus arenae TaxID=424488 RepID=A0A8J3GC20_9BACT|nr:serine--tRNA ligase [Cerasicoccus arenae]MBK1857714.1 serine--tRNA ligase [Cerasicoccus arenae]GHB91214.1 serine--tRNA ligase [Cerasicoccus arenae]
MIDLKLLRDNPAALREAIARKKFTVDWDAIYALDDQRRAAIATAESRRAEQRAASKEVGQMKDKKSAEFQERVKAMKAMSDEVKTLEEAAAAVEAEWKALFLQIPNMPHESVPEGGNEEDNIVAAEFGSPSDVSSEAVAHWDIPWFSSAIDFERGVKATGAGFPFYVGDMARFVRTLITFFLDEARDNGYTEVLPPLMVNSASATATGQLPDKEGQMYHATKDDLYLIPTAEVPVTNFFRDETFDEKDLPVYRCGYTPCFRREAGSWGAHVRGLNRLHQFDKVEMVKWVHPDTSFIELEKLREDAERILQKLGLPYRVLLMCAGDIGFPHAKQYDLEVWAGGQKRWLEVSSCSNFTDFQARRAGIRYRPAVGGKAEIVHTLNGSGLAVPRVLAALLENNLQADGSVLVPECLQKWFGSDRLGPF